MLKWNRIQTMSRRGTRDRKVNEIDNATDAERTTYKLWNALPDWT